MNESFFLIYLENMTFLTIHCEFYAILKLSLFLDISSQQLIDFFQQKRECNMQLVAGANILLTESQVEIRVKTALASHLELDVTAYLLDQQTQKVRGDADMIFYGQTATPNRSVVLLESGAKQPYLTTFQFNTAQLDPQIGKVALCATVTEPYAMNALNTLDLEVVCAGQVIAQAQVLSAQRTEKALILGEVYQHQGRWKFRFVNQGFNGGLQPLAEHYGVDISAPPTPATPPPVLSHTNASPPYGDAVPQSVSSPSPSPINLSKIRLDKQNSSINLTKKGAGFGRIRVNLNWNRQGESKQGFLNKLMNKGSIDLDLGAMIRLKNGYRDLVQPLGNAFGEYHHQPYIELEGDDRTGAQAQGENLFINGDEWDKIERIVIYTYIYQGVPNWAATDAVVTIELPNQPPIEVQLTEGGRLGTCAIVELVNQNGMIQANREVRYFKDQSYVDDYYRFGFNWSAGTKD